jgi:3-oxoacyl-[acyl-carrier protein] reductase
MPTSPDYIRQWEGYGSAGQIALKESIALRRLGTPEEVAHAVMFLASEYAAFITGQIIAVNGTPS